MAQEVVGIKIQVDGGDATKSVGSLKQQLREAQAEVTALSDKFGATSQEAVNAAKRAADLRDRIGDAKTLTDAFNPDAKFRAFSSSLSAVAGGFSAVQGAMGLIGVKSEEVEKTLLKVQSAMALSQGLQAIGEGIDSFKQMKAVAIDAFKGIKTAIGSTGIGLLVVALGTIYAYWDDIKAAVSGVSEEQKKLNAESQKNLQAAQDKLKATSSEENILKLQGKSEREILQIKVKQTDEAIKAAEINIKNIKITNQAQQVAAERNYRLLKSYIDFVSMPINFLYKAAAKGINGLITLINQIPGVDIDLTLDEQLVEKSADFVTKLAFDPEQTKRDGEETLKNAEQNLKDLQNQRAGHILAMRGIDKKGADDAAAEDAKAKQEREEKEKEHQERMAEIHKANLDAYIKRIKEAEEKRKLIQSSNTAIAEKTLKDDLSRLDNLRSANQLKLINDLINNENQTVEIRKQAIQSAMMLNEQDFNNGRINNEQWLKRKQELADAEKKIDDGVTENKKAQTEEVAGLLTNLANIVGKQTIAGKALAIATALINTYQGASEAIKQKSTLPSPLDFAAKAINVAAIIATGLKTVKSITAVQVPGVSGGGSAAAPSASIAAAPITPQVPLVNTRTQLDSQSIQQLGSATSRSYVVESDITNSQERIRRINRAARLS